MLWYIVPILGFDFLFPRRKLPDSAPTTLRLGLEVVASLLVYDTLFFAAHYTFHRVRGLTRVHVHSLERC